MSEKYNPVAFNPRAFAEEASKRDPAFRETYDGMADEFAALAELDAAHALGDDGDVHPRLPERQRRDQTGHSSSDDDCLGRHHSTSISGSGRCSMSSVPEKIHWSSAVCWTWLP